MFIDAGGCRCFPHLSTSQSFNELVLPIFNTIQKQSLFWLANMRQTGWSIRAQLFSQDAKRGLQIRVPLDALASLCQQQCRNDSVLPASQVSQSVLTQTRQGPALLIPAFRVVDLFILSFTWYHWSWQFVNRHQQPCILSIMFRYISLDAFPAKSNLRPARISHAYLQLRWCQPHRNWTAEVTGQLSVNAFHSQ